MQVVVRQLAFRPPLFPDNLFGHLVATAVPGVEEWRDGAYRCTLRLAHGPAVAALAPPGAGASALTARLLLADGRDEAEAVARCRWLLDLDADPAAVDAHLAADPLLAPMVAAAPGRRVPRVPDPVAFAVRAVLGQQVSTAAARTHAARLVRALGEPVADPEGGLTHLFPPAEAVAALDPAATDVLAMPQARRRTVIGLAAALAGGLARGLEGAPVRNLAAGPARDLDGAPDRDLDGAPDRDLDDRAAALTALAALPGIGPWTVGTVAMRALADPDAFLPSDLGVRQAAAALGLPAAPGALARRAEPWRPWRAYAVQHLWATLPHPVNRLPGA